MVSAMCVCVLKRESQCVGVIHMNVCGLLDDGPLGTDRQQAPTCPMEEKPADGLSGLFLLPFLIFFCNFAFVLCVYVVVLFHFVVVLCLFVVVLFHFLVVSCRFVVVSCHFVVVYVLFYQFSL